MHNSLLVIQHSRAPLFFGTQSTRLARALLLGLSHIRRLFLDFLQIFRVVGHARLGRGHLHRPQAEVVLVVDGRRASSGRFQRGLAQFGVFYEDWDLGPTFVDERVLFDAVRSDLGQNEVLFEEVVQVGFDQPQRLVPFLLPDLLAQTSELLVLYFSQKGLLTEAFFQGQNSLDGRVVVLVHHVQRRQERVQPLDESEVVRELQLAQVQNDQIGRFL